MITENWGDDTLKREGCALFLSNYLQRRYAAAKQANKPDTLVLNVRANWGFGKTFFVERWRKDLIAAGYPVVYFDAWTNDFSEDPLVGFIAAMDEALSEHYKHVPAVQTHVKKAFAIGKKLIKPVSLGVAGVLAKQLAGMSLEQVQQLFTDGDTDIENDASDDSKKDDEGVGTQIKSVIAKCAETAIKEHLSKRDTIKTFRERLSQLVNVLEKESGVQLPMFVFIDELDRCRPNYAIELLESIKHLFGVAGIYFITTTNLDQLGHAIKAVYGEQFDSEAYLKRFFDQEYLLPRPRSADYTAVLFKRYNLDVFPRFISPLAQHLYDSPPAEALFTEFSAAFDIGLRDQDQVAIALQAITLSWPEKEPMQLPLVLFYLMVKQKSSKVFDALTPKAFTKEPVFKMCIDVFDVSHILRHSEGRNGVVTDSIFELMWNYLQMMGNTCGVYENTNLNSINYPDRILSNILDSQPSWRQKRSDLLIINEYHGRVAQAGQLITVKA